MDDRTKSWRGYWVASPTPYEQTGTLDEPALRSVLQLYGRQGVHGVLINGTTGEWFSQSLAERRRVAEIAVEELGGVMPVVVGCTSYTPSETTLLAEHAASIGADGCCATPPPYVHPTSDETVAFFQMVTSAVDLPWMVYNWPRGTAVDIDVATLIRIAELPRVGAIKDSTGDELKCGQGCAQLADRVAFFGRFIHRAGLAVYREFGGAGNIDGGGLGAQFAVPFFESLWSGNLEQARSWSEGYVGLSSRLVRADYSGRFASPTSQLKAAMRLLGQSGGYVRPPLLELTDPETLDVLAQQLAAAGLSASGAT